MFSGITSSFEGDERRVVGFALERVVVAQRIALRPSAYGVLALQDQSDGLFQRGSERGVVLLDVDAQQEFGRFHRAAVVESRIAVVVSELLQPPCALADGRIPLFQRVFAREIEQIVPAAAGQLSPNQSRGDSLGSFVIVFVARGVIGVEHQMSDRRGSGRLDPCHRALGFQFAPRTRKVGQIAPDEAAAVTRHVHHVMCGPFHGVEDASFGLGLAGGCRLAGCCCQRQPQSAIRIRFIMSVGYSERMVNRNESKQAAPSP